MTNRHRDAKEWVLLPCKQFRNAHLVKLLVQASQGDSGAWKYFLLSFLKLVCYVRQQEPAYQGGILGDIKQAPSLWRSPNCELRLVPFTAIRDGGGVYFSNPDTLSWGGGLGTVSGPDLCPVENCYGNDTFF